MSKEVKILLNVGDEVAYSYSGQLQSIFKVVRVTATQAILPNEIRLRREIVSTDDLREVAPGAWNQRNFALATDEHRQAAKLKKTRSKVIFTLNHLIKAVESGSLEYVESVATLFLPNPLQNP